MVEDTINYSLVFHALADDTRRDILLQLNAGEKSITEISKKYAMSFSAIAKHLKIMESAALIFKKKQGRLQVISANSQAVPLITQYLKQYEITWDQRFNKLEELLKDNA